MTIAMVMKQESIVIVVMKDDDYDEFEVVEIEDNGAKYFKDGKKIIYMLWKIIIIN